MATERIKLKIKKGDTVKVIAGSEKGKSGKVVEVDTKTARIKVEGINLRKRHQKASQANPQGGIITKEAALHYSNVMLVDGKGKPTRIGKKEVAGKMVRVAKTTGEVIK
jgi:large subunit ribosomal protein L24